MTIEKELINCTSDEEKKELLKTKLEELLKVLKPTVQSIYEDGATPRSIETCFENRCFYERIYTDMESIVSIVKSLSSDKDKLDILLAVTKMFTMCFCFTLKEIREDTLFALSNNDKEWWKNYLSERKNSLLNMKDTILKSLSSFENNDMLNEIEKQFKQLDSLVILEEDMDIHTWGSLISTLYKLIYNTISGLDEKYKEYDPEIIKAKYLRQNEITLEGVETYGEGTWIKCNRQNEGVEKENYKKYHEEAKKIWLGGLLGSDDIYLFVDNNQKPQFYVSMASNHYTRR